jgi:hypothetical protein
MKRIAIALLVSAAALAASSARADTRFSVGINLGAPVYRPAPPAVVVAPAPVYDPSAPASVAYVPARGYWKEVTVKTWVPERWVMSRDRWGRSARVCEPGHYIYRTDRVWIDGRDHDRHDHDNRYDHGNRYDHDNRYGWNR